MTKAELLVDLAGRDGIESLIGDPVDRTPTGETPGVKWYKQAVWEIAGDAAVKKGVHFYVREEGLPAEDAYYKDAEPQAEPMVQHHPLHVWMRDAIDANLSEDSAPECVIEIRDDAFFRRGGE